MMKEILMKTLIGMQILNVSFIGTVEKITNIASPFIASNAKMIFDEHQLMTVEELGAMNTQKTQGKCSANQGP